MTLRWALCSYFLLFFSFYFFISDNGSTFSPAQNRNKFGTMFCINLKKKKKKNKTII